jgi:hypothetical protein
MAKFSSPLGQGKEVWISQTDHGSSNRAVDIGSVQAGQPVYAVADGKVNRVSSGGGSYCSQQIAGSTLTVWYVHTYNWVANGTFVKKGQKICEIAPSSKNGGYPVHLHLGITPTTYSIMSYMDRTIPFRTKYSDIKASWFTGDNLNWSIFPDKSYLPLYSKGQKLEILKDMNIRDANQNDIGSAKAGSVCVVEDIAYVYKGYQFYKVKFADKQCFIADTDFNRPTSKNMTNLDGSQPQTETDILKEEIKRLELIVGAQKTELDKLNQIIESKDKEIDKLSGVVGAAQEFCTAHTKLEDECNKL